MKTDDLQTLTELLASYHKRNTAAAIEIERLREALFVCENAMTRMIWEGGVPNSIIEEARDNARRVLAGR
jgi:hypothetical protein